MLMMLSAMTSPTAVQAFWLRRLTTLMRLSDPVRHFWRAPALLALG